MGEPLLHVGESELSSKDDEGIKSLFHIIT